MANSVVTVLPTIMALAVAGPQCRSVAFSAPADKTAENLSRSACRQSLWRPLCLLACRQSLAFAAERGVAGVIGIALYVYALALHPLIALVAGRPLQAAEVVGIAPDRTAIATLGLLTLAPRRAGNLPLIILPIIWCLASALTLRTMGASEGWIPLTAAALAVLAQAWPRRNGTCSNSDAAPGDQRRPVRGSAVVGRSGVPGVHAPCRRQ
jgi:uncharacterized protein DUF6064